MSENNVSDDSQINVMKVCRFVWDGNNNYQNVESYALAVMIVAATVIIIINIIVIGHFCTHRTQNSHRTYFHCDKWLSAIPFDPNRVFLISFSMTTSYIVNMGFACCHCCCCCCGLFASIQVWDLWKSNSNVRSWREEAF